jgi:hypothetical protein
MFLLISWQRIYHGRYSVSIKLKRKKSFKKEEAFEKKKIRTLNPK